MNYCLEHYVPPPGIFFVLHIYFHVQQGCPGIWIACTYLPPRRRGRKKKKIPPFFWCVCDLCDNRTEEAYPHIKANKRNTTSHPSYDILYLVLFWFLAWLYTAGRVLNGHAAVLTCTRSSAYS